MKTKINKKKPLISFLCFSILAFIFFIKTSAASSQEFQCQFNQFGIFNCGTANGMPIRVEGRDRSYVWDNRYVNYIGDYSYFYITSGLAGTAKLKKCGKNIPLETRFLYTPLEGTASARVLVDWRCTDSELCPGGWLYSYDDQVCEYNPWLEREFCYYPNAIFSLTEPPAGTPNVIEAWAYNACHSWEPLYSSYSSPLSCTTRANVPQFSHGQNIDIQNLPPYIRNSGDWQHCDSNETADPRDHPSEDNRKPNSDKCSWTERNPSNCPRVKENVTFVPLTTETFTCSAADPDGAYDAFFYSFFVEKTDGGSKVQCGSSATAIPGATGAWCKTNGSQLVFYSPDTASKYEATCQVDDGNGAQDWAKTILTAGSSPAPTGPTCDCTITSGKSIACPGDSSTFSFSTHPDNASLSWKFYNVSSGAIISQGTGKTVSQTFATDQAGKTFQLSGTVSDAGQTGDCSPTACRVTINQPSCSCKIDTDDPGVDLGSLIAGTQIEITIKTECLTLAPNNQYKFEIFKNSSPALLNTDYRVISGATENFQSTNPIKIEILQPGVYKASPSVIKDDSSQKSCQSCEATAHTPETKWWEGEPR
ncbi:MAG: hypothetical protein ABIC19_02935 [Patescibacteria group bacterium]|nr:hypothetical protein [Patescibacteria group bacterium]